MLYSIKDLDGFELAASDGVIGKVKEVYFDDQHWVIRHLVVDTGSWLSGRRVLISPHSIKRLDRPVRRLEVALTRQQVEDAPGVETRRPVSRQQEMAAYDYYGYPYYWGGSGLWGMLDLPLGGAIPLGGMPSGLAPETARDVIAAERDAGDPHLRSSAETIGYDVAARDGDIGHIADYLFDEHSWQISFAVVDTNNWLPDRLVLVSPSWVERVDWSERKAVFRVSRQAVETSPPYLPEQVLSHNTVQQVQRHFEHSE